MATYYWISTTPGANASDATQWSNAGPGGAPLGAWPGSSPDASDDFLFDFNSTANCNWDIAAVQSIQQSIVADENYTGIITFANNVALKGLILNGEITDGGTGYALTFSGTPLTALDDASSKSRYVLNGQKAKHGSGSTLLYKIQPASTDVHLDNGPYNKLTIDTNTMTLAYNVPTATTHDNADDGTIHIKSDFVATAGGGFLRDTAPDASEDTAVKIKFDTTNITYTNETMDFVMATAFFRGVEIPTTGAQTYGSSTAGFSTKYYGLVIFASSDGELSTIPNGLQLDCYSLEIKAGARLRVQSGSSTPAIIKSQTQPKVKGVWSFESLNSHVFTSPRSNPVSSVANGGTGLSSVEANALLMGNASTPMRPLVEIPPGTNGYVLTMVGGTPAWAAASGGGGSGTVTSVAVTGSDGLQVDSGSPITTSGTIALGVDAAALRTHINVENGADVTDTANVTAAGALMDSEVTNLADVKAFDPADYAPATQETCMVRLDTSITSFTPTSAYTLLQSNIPNPIWDDPANSNFDPNTGLYTVPSDGVYRISWNVAFRFTASGQTQASRIYVNGNPAAQGNVNTTGNWPIGGGSILLTLTATDTVGLYVYISATGKNLVGDTTSVGAVHLSINKVSE